MKQIQERAFYPVAAIASHSQGLAARRGPCSDPARERLLMGEASAKYYLACLLEALGYLHGRSLLHRDVSGPSIASTHRHIARRAICSCWGSFVCRLR